MSNYWRKKPDHGLGLTGRSKSTICVTWQARFNIRARRRIGWRQPERDVLTQPRRIVALEPMLAKPRREIGPRLLEDIRPFDQDDCRSVLPIETRSRTGYVRWRFVVARNPRWKARREWPVSQERNLRREAADEDARRRQCAAREVADERRITWARLDLGRRVHKAVGHAASLPDNGSRRGDAVPGGGQRDCDEYQCRRGRHQRSNAECAPGEYLSDERC